MTNQRTRGNQRMRSNQTIRNYNRQQQSANKKRKQKSTIKSIILFSITIIILICLFQMKSNETKRNYHYETTTVYFVSQGETLWTIAKQFSDNRHDIRQVVWEIQTLSETTALIFPGQELTIPLFTVLQNGE